jgi:glyoxylase-like metal-dependent hydrolase (beta-lactamase superfamily II)
MIFTTRCNIVNEVMMKQVIENYICQTCGTQFSSSEQPPEACPICLDERQYIGFNGQEWTTLAALQLTHTNLIEPLEPGLTGIGSQPAFAIRQRALLVQTAGGNVLWDCISLINNATIEAVNELGGISAIAISHPHFYSSMIEWSQAFNAPVYLHNDDHRWVMRPDPAIVFWQGETYPLWDGLTLIRCGGHFPGGTVLHWLDGAGGKGALLSGDILTVVPDRRYVSFMYSFPNLIPLPAGTVRRILTAVEPYPFERIYGAWWERVVAQDGKTAVRRSAERYIRAITSVG